MSSNLKLAFTIDAVDRATGPIMAIRRTIQNLVGPAARVRNAYSGVAEGVTAATRSALAVGASVGAGLFGMRRIADTVDRIADAAASLGMTTQKLQQFGYAAQLNGSSLDEMSQSLIFLNKNMAEARDGNAEMVQWMRRAGITSADLRNRSFTAADGLLRIADKFKQVGNVGDNAQRKVAVSTQLLGRQGFRMIQLLNGGASALEELFAEAERYGVIISDDSIRRVGAFNDEWDRLRGTLFGATVDAAAKATPVLQGLIKKFAEWAAVNRVLISTKVEDFFKRINDGLPKFLDGASKVWTMFNRLASGADRVSQALGGWPNLLALLAGLMGAKMVLAVFELAAALRVLNAAAWANPLTWVLAAVVALVAAIPLLVLQWDKVIEKLYQLDKAAPAWLRLMTGPALKFVSSIGGGPQPEGTWSPAPEGSWESSPLLPNRQVAPYSAFPSKADRFDMGGVLDIRIRSDGKTRVEDFRKKPGSLLDLSVDVGNQSGSW